MVKRLSSCVVGVPNRKEKEKENVTEEIFEEILAVHFFQSNEKYYARSDLRETAVSHGLERDLHFLLRN